MKNKKAIIGIIIAVAAVAAAVTLAIIYKNELKEIIAVVKNKIDEKKRVTKTSEKSGLYEAMDIGAVWLKRALEK